MTIQRYEFDGATKPSWWPSVYISESDYLADLAIYEARLAEDAKVRAQLVEALELALSYTDSHLLKAYEREELEKMQAALAAAKMVE